MATFTRGGVTYPSQYAYRRALAERLGYDSVAEHRKASYEATHNETFQELLASLPASDRPKMQAILWHYKGALGEYVQGKPKDIPADLSDLIDEMEARLGRRPFMIWRWLYSR